MICLRCGINPAWSEAEVANVLDRGGPSLAAGVCIHCMGNDIRLLNQLNHWIRERNRVGNDARMLKLTREIETLGPADALYRFVESFR